VQVFRDHTLGRLPSQALRKALQGRGGEAVIDYPLPDAGRLPADFLSRLAAVNARAPWFYGWTVPISRRLISPQSPGRAGGYLCLSQPIRHAPAESAGKLAEQAAHGLSV